MSELKAKHAYTIDEIETIGSHAEGNEYYLKAEADKVIAEKDKKIKELEEHIDELQKATDSAWSKVNVYYDELSHSNHKRCLDMARWCFEKSYSTTLVKYDEKSGLLRNFYDWWGKRWLELADEPTWEKFLQLIRKEAK